MKKISVQILSEVFPKSDIGLVNQLVPHLQNQLPHFLIDSPLEVCHFLAQAAHETDDFNSLTEYASGASYEGRKDLGNVQAGDGKFFRGHGIFQVTGRKNHFLAGQEILNEEFFGNDRFIFKDNAVLKVPVLLALPSWAVASACFYWNRNNLSSLCMPDEEKVIIRRKIKGVWANYECSPIEAITRRINGGMNGFDERKENYEKLKIALL
jgi:putative chitinase